MNPKYSLIEIEKRWLVDKDKLPDLTELKCIEVTDKYFPDTRTRLRRMFDCDKSETVFKFTKKYGKNSTYSGPLTTLYLSEYEYDLFNKTPGNILIKKIYHYPFCGKNFLIEIFIKPMTDFILLEAEAASEAELNQLTIPDFASGDVTGEKKYEGYSLACVSGKS